MSNSLNRQIARFFKTEADFDAKNRLKRGIEKWYNHREDRLAAPGGAAAGTKAIQQLF
jgi:hypothetical protein